MLHVAPASASVPGYDRDQEHATTVTTVTGPCRSSATGHVYGVSANPLMMRASSQAILPVAFPAHLISALLLKSQK